jgi:hypothetical protein
MHASAALMLAYVFVLRKCAIGDSEEETDEDNSSDDDPVGDGYSDDDDDPGVLPTRFDCDPYGWNHSHMCNFYISVVIGPRGFTTI